MSSSSSAAPTFPRYQLANIPISLAIFFGIWVCYVAGSSEYDNESNPMPLAAITVPLQTVGLFFFRAKWMITFVFYLAIVAHIFEGAIALKFAIKVSSSSTTVSKPLFVLFWFLQTFAVGFPSLKLIKEQRRIQLQQEKKKKNDGGAK